MTTVRKLNLWFKDFEHPRLSETDFTHERIPRSPLRATERKGATGFHALAYFLVQARLSADPASFRLSADGDNAFVVESLREVVRRPPDWFTALFGTMATALFKNHGKTGVSVELVTALLPPSSIHVYWRNGDEIDTAKPPAEVDARPQLVALAEKLRSDFNSRKNQPPVPPAPAPKPEPVVDPPPAADPPAAAHTLDATCFGSRQDTTEDLMTELRAYQKLVFLGISHQQLAGLLKRVLQNLRGRETLPWESVEVYFVRDDIGEVYEQAQFHNHLCASRRQIADVLINEFDKLPRLREVAFMQSNSTRSQTGCLLGDPGPPPVFHVGYLPITVPPGTPDEAPTLKLASRGGEEARQPIRDALLKLYQAVRENHHPLGTFRRTLWDRSVKRWSEFCTASKVQQAGMLKLVEFAKFRPNEQVLELAAGTGDLSHFLVDGLEEAAAARLTVLDGSPGMLRAARRVLQGRADYALCRLSSVGDGEGYFDDRRNIDIRGTKFDAIVMYQALFAVANNEAGLARVARWCARHLKPRGRVILSAHNTAVQMDTVPPFDRDSDPLRVALRETAVAMGLEAHIRKNEVSELTIEGVERAFRQASFAPGRPCETYRFENPNAERHEMWRVPAILDSFIDVERVGFDAALDLANRAIGSLPPDLPPFGRTVACWEFVLNDTPDPAAGPR